MLDLPLPMHFPPREGPFSPTAASTPPMYLPRSHRAFLFLWEYYALFFLSRGFGFVLPARGCAWVLHTAFLLISPSTDHLRSEVLVIQIFLCFFFLPSAFFWYYRSPHELGGESVSSQFPHGSSPVFPKAPKFFSPFRHVGRCGPPLPTFFVTPSALSSPFKDSFPFFGPLFSS